MKTPYPMEALNRAPIEWCTTAVCLAFIAVVWGWPHVFHLPWPLKGWLIASLSGLGVWRAMQGLASVRYHHALARAHAKFSASTNDLPMRPHQLFLGRGFRWQPIHTQRLRDLDVRPRTDHPLPATATHPPETLDGNPALHSVGLKEHNIYMDLTARAGHLLVVGTTGVGKTRFAEILLSQDIHRGDVVIIIDPKGDIDLLRRIIFEAQNAGREDDLRMVHLGFPSVSARYNPIGQFIRSTEVANRLANSLPDAGESAAFQAFAWKFTNVITHVLVAMGIKPSYQRLKRYVHQLDQLLIDYLTFLLGRKALEHALQTALEGDESPETSPPHRATRACIQYIRDQNLAHTYPLLEELIAVCEYEKTHVDKLVVGLSVLLDKLTTGEVATLINPDYDAPNDPRPILDWMQAIRQRQIVYVGLDALSDATIASSVGQAMLSDLVSVAGQRYQHGLHFDLPEPTVDEDPIIQLHVDEVNEVMGDEFIPLLNKARGAGFRVTAYTQTLSDIEARLHSHAKTQQVIGNLGTILLFRVREARTAQTFVDQLPTVRVHTLTPTSSVTDSVRSGSHDAFTSQNEDRLMAHDHPLLAVSDVLQLPKGQAFARLPGGDVYKLRMPEPVMHDPMLLSDTHTLIQNIQIRPRTHLTSLDWDRLQQRAWEHTSLNRQAFATYYAPLLKFLFAKQNTIDGSALCNALTRRQGLLLPLHTGSETIAKQHAVWTYAGVIACLLTHKPSLHLSTLTASLPAKAIQWLKEQPLVWEELKKVDDKGIQATMQLQKMVMEGSANTMSFQAMQRTHALEPAVKKFLNWVERKLKQQAASTTFNRSSYFFTHPSNTGQPSVWISAAGIDHYCRIKEITRDHLWQALCTAEIVETKGGKANDAPSSETFWPLHGISASLIPSNLPIVQEPSS